MAKHTNKKNKKKTSPKHYGSYYNSETQNKTVTQYCVDFTRAFGKHLPVCQHNLAQN